MLSTTKNPLTYWGLFVKIMETINVVNIDNNSIISKVKTLVNNYKTI